MGENSNQIFLIYDKECPACNNYCQIVRIRESIGTLHILDARESSDIMDEITAHGLDIDQGMVLKVDDQLYYGADAIHTLALMSSRSNVLNRLNYWIFRSKTISYVLYPVLRLFRNMLLTLSGKTKINNLKKSHNSKF